MAKTREQRPFQAVVQRSIMQHGSHPRSFWQSQKYIRAQNYNNCQAAYSVLIFDMNIPISQSVFPSYNRIKSDILNQQQASYQHKIGQLRSRLAHMHAAHDPRREHQLIRQSILALTPPPDSSSFFKDPLKLQRPHHPTELNAESLNYYIDDDGDTDNNYETFLKFKKKALERDLQQEEMESLENKKQKRKEKQEDQQFFKNLYLPPHPTLTQPKPKGTSKFPNRAQSANSQPLKYQQLKENASLFVSSTLKSTKANKSNSSLRKNMSKARIQESEGERNAFETNRKYLLENYLQVLKKLENTNIVKLRVLNPQQSA